MITQVELQGSDRLAATLETAAKKTANMDAALASARIIATAGASTAPVQTGRLAGSLRASRASEKNTGTITTPVVYAVPIHWGSPARGIKANPFLIRGADQSEAQWIRAWETDLEKTANAVKGV